MDKTLASLKSLVRDMDYQLDEAARVRAQFENARDALIHERDTLKADLHREQMILDHAHNVHGDPASHPHESFYDSLILGGAALCDYQKRIQSKLNDLMQQCDQYDVDIQEQHTIIMDLFAQKKAYDTLIKKREADIKKTADKHEREALDEIGAQNFTQPVRLP